MFCNIRVSKKILEGVKKLNNEIIEKVIGDFVESFPWTHGEFNQVFNSNF